MKKRVFAVTFGLMFAFAQNLLAQQIFYDLKAHTPKNAAGRSLILPGWGQAFNGQKTKAYIVGGLALTSVAVAYISYTTANSTYSDYEARGVKNDPLYNDYETQSNQAMVASFVAVGVWIYGVIDAHRVAARAYRENKTSQINIQNIPSGLALVYEKRF